MAELCGEGEIRKILFDSRIRPNTWDRLRWRDCGSLPSSALLTCSGKGGLRGVRWQ